MTRLNWDRDRRRRAVQRGFRSDAHVVGGFRDAAQRKRDAERKVEIEQRRNKSRAARKAQRRKEAQALSRQDAVNQRRQDAQGQRWLRRWRSDRESGGGGKASR